MSRVRCFVMEHTKTSRYRLRRYQRGPASCPGGRVHNARGPVIGDTEDDPDQKWLCTNAPKIEDSDPRWPTQCDRCGHLFTDADARQVAGDPLFRRLDTGEILTQEEAPAGALWRATYYEDDKDWCGFDGQAWMCKLPDGVDWYIDGPANNCTRKGDKTHRCWIREGQAPDFNVGKNGPNTCSAGAGSIATSGYHGFLRRGWLESC